MVNWYTELNKTLPFPMFIYYQHKASTRWSQWPLQLKMTIVNKTNFILQTKFASNYKLINKLIHHAPAIIRAIQYGTNCKQLQVVCKRLLEVTWTDQSVLGLRWTTFMAWILFVLLRAKHWTWLWLHSGRKMTIARCLNQPFWLWFTAFCQFFSWTSHILVWLDWGNGSSGQQVY